MGVWKDIGTPAEIGVPTFHDKDTYCQRGNHKLMSEKWETWVSSSEGRSEASTSATTCSSSHGCGKFLFPSEKQVLSNRAIGIRASKLPCLKPLSRHPLRPPGRTCRWSLCATRGAAALCFRRSPAPGPPRCAAPSTGSLELRVASRLRRGVRSSPAQREDRTRNMGIVSLRTQSSSLQSSVGHWELEKYLQPAGQVFSVAFPELGASQPACRLAYGASLSTKKRSGGSLRQTQLALNQSFLGLRKEGTLLNGN